LWEDLAVFNYDRMLGKAGVMVRKLRHLVAADADEIAQEAYLRALSMALRFEKLTLGQARAAMVKAAYYTVMDWNRARGGELRHEAGSFDDRHDYQGADSDYSPYDSRIAGWNADVTLEQVERLMELDSAATLRAIRAEARGEAAPGALPALVQRGRTRSRLTVRALAGRLSSALSLASEREDKVVGYVEQLERGELDGRRLSRGVIDALSCVLSIDTSVLEGASLLGGPAPAGALFRGADADSAADVRDRLQTLAEAMATPAPSDWDEVDELFLGGR
jgi:DNA-directed RNA polymerase specialized sigma24 family protein